MKKSVYWLDAGTHSTLPSLQENVEADAVVVGGGITGLSAAQWLREQAGLDVVLLEASFCGAGASGLGSGLVSPDTELDAHQLERRFGTGDARFLMESAMAAVEHIRQTIARHKIACGYTPADGFYVADGRTRLGEVVKEHESRLELGLQSRFYERREVPGVLGTDRFHGGLRYGGTFGMNGFEYVQALRNVLMRGGLRVYENTPAQSVESHRVRTLGGSVRAKHVIVCVDRAAPFLGVEERDVYHQQSFITVSAPLGAAVQQEMFPDGPLLVHDAHVLFHYFRLLPSGRLVLGGSLGRKAYDRQPADPGPAARALVRWVRGRFPVLKDVEFTHTWAGLFGLSKDMLPIAGRVPGADGNGKGPLHVALCGGSMAWSVLAGQVAARTAVEGPTPLGAFLKPGRAFTPVEPLTSALPKGTAFRLSHIYTQKLLQGRSDAVAQQQRRVKLAAIALAGGAALGGGLFWLRRRRR